MEGHSLVLVWTSQSLATVSGLGPDLVFAQVVLTPVQRGNPALQDVFRDSHRSVSVLSSSGVKVERSPCCSLQSSVSPCGRAGRGPSRPPSTTLPAPLVLPSACLLVVRPSVCTDALWASLASTLHLVNSSSGSGRDFHRSIIVCPKLGDGSDWTLRCILASDYHPVLRNDVSITVHASAFPFLGLPTLDFLMGLSR